MPQLPDDPDAPEEPEEPKDDGGGHAPEGGGGGEGALGPWFDDPDGTHGGATVPPGGGPTGGDTPPGSGTEPEGPHEPSIDFPEVPPDPRGPTDPPHPTDPAPEFAWVPLPHEPEPGGDELLCDDVTKEVVTLELCAADDALGVRECWVTVVLFRQLEMYHDADGTVTLQCVAIGQFTTGSGCGPCQPIVV